MPRPRSKRQTSVEIYQGADGAWHGYITVGVKPDGRPDRRHRMARTEAECADKIRLLEEQYTRGEVSKPGRVPTLAEWLVQWLDTIVSDLRYGTLQKSYGWAVRKHLIPGLGAHRLDKLEAGHIEAFYRAIARGEDSDAREGLGQSSVDAVHRVLRAAINEAVRRGVIVRNPMSAVRAPRVEEDEVTPLYVSEVKQILAVCAGRRNGTRWTVGLPLGFRQGEALGLPWAKPVTSTREKPVGLDLESGFVDIRTKAERRTWRHGCDDPQACGYQIKRVGGVMRPLHHFEPCAPGCKRHAKLKRGCPPPCARDCVGHARSCPKKTGGGIVFSDPKSFAGRRRLALAEQMLMPLRTHHRDQKKERLKAGAAWQDNGLVWCQPNGAPIDAREDWADWKAILKEAGVRNARVHDGRHTAATMLLLQGVDPRVVMDIMGWSDGRMLKRYQHVVDELLQEATRRIGALLWDTPPPSSATDHATVPFRRSSRH